MLFRTARPDIVTSVGYGSQAVVDEGIAATRRNSRCCDERWFAGSSTIILGADGADNKKSHTRTVATWLLPVDPQLIGKIKSGYLIIGCERSQGGLHTNEYGATATVGLNGNNRDLIGLKDIPPGHSDYFHRVAIPKLPDFWPISGCGTIYAWPVHAYHLNSTGNQSVRVEIEPNVSWDIDYVVLVLSAEVLFFQFPGWLEKLFFALLGAILGAMAKNLIP